MKSSFEAYVETQNSIYDKMSAVSAQVGITEGIEYDPGTAPQAAFLVAWRHPEHITEEVGEFSLAVSGVYRALTYNTANAHTTLSDYGLTPNLIITPDSPDHAATLDALTVSVRDALDSTPDDVLAARGVAFGDMVSNKKIVIALGQPTEAIWQVNQAVKSASARHGINDGDGLKGSWGAHMTVNRFLEDYSAGDATELSNMLAAAPVLGDSKPTAIDVGYFQTDPEQGFIYTTHERFDLR